MSPWSALAMHCYTRIPACCLLTSLHLIRPPSLLLSPSRQAVNPSSDRYFKLNITPLKSRPASPTIEFAARSISGSFGKRL